MTQTLSLEDIEAFAHDCLTRAGVPPRVARPVAVEIAGAEASGERQHGLQGLLRDIRLIRYGLLTPDAPVKLHHPRPGVLVLDAGHGFAAAAVAGVVPDLAQAALSQGIAVLQLMHASAPGAMIAPLTRLAQDGLLAMALSDHGPVRIARPPDPSVVMHGHGCDIRPLHAGAADPAPDDDDPTVRSFVAHRARLIVADPEAVGPDAFEMPTPADTIPVPPRHTVTLEADLLARIVAA
jgi:(2R)-3-sulfolactate dehydrogenase (NADP+)